MRTRITLVNSLLYLGIISMAVQNAQADSVELVNGDILNGKVFALDDVELRMQSDLHGELRFARDKVATIALGERKLSRPAAAIVDGRRDEPGVVSRTIQLGPRPGAAATTAGTTTATVEPGSVADVVRQLRAKGLQVQTINDLKKEMPLLNDPGVKKYFDTTVEGLQKGELDVSDIRKDAVRVREEFRKTAKSLGPEGEKTLNQALGSYLQILDNFIKETEPKKEDAAKAPPPAEDSKKEAEKAESKAESKSAGASERR
jgi:hypothetical protein